MHSSSVNKCAFIYLGFDEQQKLKREETLSRPIFSTSSPKKVNSEIATYLKKTKMEALLKPLSTTELGIQKKVPDDCKSFSNSETVTASKEKFCDDDEDGGASNCIIVEKTNILVNSPEKNEERTSLVAFDYDSSSGDES